MTFSLGQLLSQFKTELKDAGSPSFDLDAELIFSEKLSLSRSELILHSDKTLDLETIAQLKEAKERRMQGEPIAYILGQKGFFKSDFFVNSHVLIPRPESEHVVEIALEYCKRLEASTLVDMGCGSGCIGLSVLKELPEAKGLLVDISLPAIEVSQKNAQSLNILDRSSFLVKSVLDLDAKSLEPAAVIVANPPYIALGSQEVEQNVKNYEPAKALFSGPTGLEDIKAWAEKAQQLLLNPGVFICEIGYDQGQALKEKFKGSHRWTKVHIEKDYSGKDRVLVLEKGTING